eukprot:7930399-Lingulodinium_polyedra.AAC.1
MVGLQDRQLHRGEGPLHRFHIAQLLHAQLTQRPGRRADGRPNRRRRIRSNITKPVQLRQPALA